MTHPGLDHGEAHQGRIVAAPDQVVAHQHRFQPRPIQEPCAHQLPVQQIVAQHRQAGGRDLAVIGAEFALGLPQPHAVWQPPGEGLPRQAAVTAAGGQTRCR